MQFIGAPLMGRLSDHMAQARPMASQVGTLIGFRSWDLPNTLCSCSWLIIDGLSGPISTAQAAISDSTTEKTCTQGLAC
jgi:hypothetical protein